ncbi:hypothetical protein HRS9139_10510 [Pyrenophora teres f. teres]|nr:hypothetical protein HRS9139_10510 [Pyrenophora teres f. teres]
MQAWANKDGDFMPRSLLEKEQDHEAKRQEEAEGNSEGKTPLRSMLETTLRKAGQAHRGTSASHWWIFYSRLQSVQMYNEYCRVKDRFAQATNVRGRGDSNSSLARTALAKKASNLPEFADSQLEDLARKIKQDLEKASLWHRLSFEGKDPLILAFTVLHSHSSVQKATRRVCKDIKDDKLSLESLSKPLHRLSQAIKAPLDSFLLNKDKSTSPLLMYTRMPRSELSTFKEFEVMSSPVVPGDEKDARVVVGWAIEKKL